MKRITKKLLVPGFGIGILVLTLAPSAGAAEPKAHPKTFVGKTGDCGTGYAAGSSIVTAGWVKGIGLPDNGGSNSNLLDPTNNPNKSDDRYGLLLSKNGPTEDCSAAGADFTGVNGITLTELGFDIPNGKPCGAGAQRFNVVATDGFHFLGGCSNGTQTPAPQDPAAWTRVRIDPTNPAQAFPTITPGATVISIQIVFDEGTTQFASPSTTLTPPGLAVIVNIDVNGTLIPKE